VKKEPTIIMTTPDTFQYDGKLIFLNQCMRIPVHIPIRRASL
jgi:hypothetical protein